MSFVNGCVVNGPTVFIRIVLESYATVDKKQTQTIVSLSQTPGCQAYQGFKHVVRFKVDWFGYPRAPQ